MRVVHVLCERVSGQVVGVLAGGVLERTAQRCEERVTYRVGLILQVSPVVDYLILLLGAQLQRSFETQLNLLSQYRGPSYQSSGACFFSLPNFPTEFYTATVFLPVDNIYDI